MSIETDYTPRYVDSLEDLPLSGPDNYSAEDKRKALFNAESSLEVDTNNGKKIPADELTNAHKAAVLNLATHALTHAAGDPADVTIGDMSSGGGASNEYSSRFLEEYNRFVEQIVDSGASGHGNFSVSNQTTERAEGAEEQLY